MAAEQTLGQRLREVREGLGVPQDDLARRARQVGLTWTRSTVAKIEIGLRELKANELLVLPFLLEVRLLDLMPVSQFTDLGPGVSKWESGLLRRIARGQRGPRPVAPHSRAGIAQAGEAERKAARTLGLGLDTVLARALLLWDRSLTGERERRLKRRIAPNAQARTVQAIRGRITRELLAELANVNGEGQR